MAAAITRPTPRVCGASVIAAMLGSSPASATACGGRIEQVRTQDHRMRHRVEPPAQFGGLLWAMRAQNLCQQGPGECDQHEWWTGNRWCGTCV